MNNKIILASASPRRKELLKLLFEDFSVIASDIEETVPDGLPIEERPEYLAKLKAADIYRKFPDFTVIGADTSVLLENEILGKPKNADDAKRMLKLLSGRIHKVITGCAVYKNGECKSFSVTTLVEFYTLSDKEINEYIESKEPFDKAGGYGIQSKGALFVKGITGDYFNVVGLPVAELKKVLDKF